LRIFIDNNLAPRHARALSALLAPDHEVVHLRDKFPASTDDGSWLERLGVEGDWVVITGDTRIMTSPHLRAAWSRSGLTTFILKSGWMKQDLFEQHARLTRAMKKLIEHAAGAAPGTRFSVALNGKVERAP
jgi:hypothetical protein